MTRFTTPSGAETSRLRGEVTRLLAVVEMQNRLAATALDPDTMMTTIAHTAAQLCGADAGVVELVEDDEMVYRAVAGTAEDHLGFRLKIDTSLSGRCVTEGRTLRCDNATADPRVDQEAAVAIGALSLLCVPLSGDRGGHRGVLKVYADRPCAFDDEDVTILTQLSASIAAHIGRAEEYERKALESRRDILTDLGNRRAYEERLASDVARVVRYRHPLSLVLLDLDHFKSVNDTAGHPAGDQVLRNTAAALRRVRRSDDCYRIGGDEFAIVLPDTPPDGAGVVASRLQEAIRDANLDTGVTACFGAAGFEQGDWSELHATADARLIAAKLLR